MSSSKFMKASALALACASVVSAEKVYTCDASDNYEGSNFFEGFDFFTGLDPTRGYVQYQSKADAASSKLGGPLTDIKGGKAYIGVDYWNKYNPIGDGRPSVRIETKKTYTHGLYLLDIAHMPASICGTWPAFWSFSDVNYPSQGEIDILENIHENTVTLNALHTSPGFSISGNKIANQQSGEVTSYNCDDTAQGSDYGPQYLNQGCASVNADPNSYGKSLNAIGGGVYAMEWTSEVIRMWNFGAGKVPSDITSGKPDPSTWGTPSFTTANGKGDIDAHFKDHKLVLDTTFCGNYAGQDVFWKATSCYDPVKYPTCSSYVGANPAAFKDASWLVNSLKVYKLTEPVIPSNDTTTSSSTTSSSTTSSSITSSSTVVPTSTHYGNSSTPATPTPTPTGGPLTTSTVYSTSTGTVTSCAPTVTNCPYGSVTTVVIPLYTTICPVGANPTGKPGSGSGPAPTSGPACSGPSCHVSGSGSGGSSSSGSTPPPASGSGSSSGSTPPPASGSTSSGSSSSGNTPSLSCVGASCPPVSGPGASSSSSGTTPPTSGSSSGSSSGASSGSSSSTTPTTCSGASCPPASGPSPPSSSAGITPPAPACGGVGNPACPASTLIVTPTKGSGNGTAVGTGGVAGPTSGINLSYTPITTNGAGVVRTGSAMAVVIGLVAAMLM